MYVYWFVCVCMHIPYGPHARTHTPESPLVRMIGRVVSLLFYMLQTCTYTYTNTQMHTHTYTHTHTHTTPYTHTPGRSLRAKDLWMHQLFLSHAASLTLRLLFFVEDSALPPPAPRSCLSRMRVTDES